MTTVTSDAIGLKHPTHLQAGHAGKVLAIAPPAPLLPPSAPARGRASVVVTGGAGGLGLLFARWAATTGQARRVTLISRGGRLGGSGGAGLLLAGLGPGVEVVVAAADAGGAQDAADAWERLAGGADVLLHAAGTLQVRLTVRMCARMLVCGLNMAQHALAGV